MAAIGPRGGPWRGPEPLSNASIGELVNMVTDQVTTLVKAELELAKTELREQAVKAAKAGGLGGAAGMAAVLSAGFAGLAMARLLSTFLPKGLAYAFLAAAYGAAAATLLQRARKEAQTIEPIPRETIETIKETAIWGTEQTS
jgi:hypothetical protein